MPAAQPPSTIPSLALLAMRKSSQKAFDKAQTDICSTQILYPSGWAGRIYVGKDFNPDGSKIEASFSPPNYQPNVDVSYGKHT